MGGEKVLIGTLQQLVEHVFILDNKKIAVDADVEDLLGEMFVISGPAMLVEEYVKDQNVWERAAWPASRLRSYVEH